MYIWQEYHRGDILLIAYHWVAYNINYPITGGVNFDHFIKVVATRLLHYKVFLFVFSKYFLERNLETL